MQAANIANHFGQSLSIVRNLLFFVIYVVLISRHSDLVCKLLTTFKIYLLPCIHAHHLEWCAINSMKSEASEEKDPRMFIARHSRRKARVQAIFLC